MIPMDLSSVSVQRLEFVDGILAQRWLWLSYAVLRQHVTRVHKGKFLGTRATPIDLSWHGGALLLRESDTLELNS
jgi:hypothetical protein